MMVWPHSVDATKVEAFDRLCRTMHRRGSQTNRYAEMATALAASQPLAPSPVLDGPGPRLLIGS
jgi:hypothetical protein